ncbi:hypothetical protein B7486_04555 [cyanobacterium TDX16]|nr:hypothetical protein B7486_04555 [cyanobacterium TDX16]
MKMPTSITHYGNVTVCSVTEDLAGENTEEFANHVKKLESEGRHDVVVDFAEADAIDSRGLELLLELQSQCENGLGRIRLCGLNQTVQKVLEITRLSRRFEVCADIDAAVRSFA